MGLNRVEVFWFFVGGRVSMCSGASLGGNIIFHSSNRICSIIGCRRGFEKEKDNMIGIHIEGLEAKGIVRGTCQRGRSIRTISARQRGIRCLFGSSTCTAFVRTSACRRFAVPLRMVKSKVGFLGRNRTIITLCVRSSPTSVRVPGAIRLTISRTRPNAGNSSTGGPAGGTALRGKLRISIPLFIGVKSVIGIGARANICLKEI